MKAPLTDLDYFRTKDDIIFLVKGYHHPEKLVIAVPVFWGDADGERVHSSGRRYRKDVKEVYRNPEIPKCALRVALNDIVEVFKPRLAFERFLAESKGSVWRKIVITFNEVAGVPLDDIGIFGSYLVGLAKKDIDFLIYGLDNFRKLRDGGFKKIQQNLGFGPISEEHIRWHTAKYGQYLEPGLTNFSETLKRKWPTLQIGPGLLSTVRFVYKEDEVPSDPLSSPPAGKIRIRGKVQETEKVHFMPRVFDVLSSGGRMFRIVTYFWAFYCAVKEGDEVEITGTIHEDGCLISVDDYSSGIKIIN